MILEAMKKYQQNIINATEYDKEMMQGHRVLQEYAVLLKESICSKIEITPDGVKCEVNLFNKSFKMFLDDADLSAVSAQILAYNEYEPAESAIVASIINELEDNSVVFDVGANLGWYSLLMSSIKPSISYYAFEPVENTYKRLVKNFEENRILTQNCYNIGFYNENKLMEFYYDTAASGASSLVDLRGMNTAVKINTRMVKLDDFVQEKVISNLDFIKCDVEGAELFVFQGGLKTIERYQPIIFSEMLRKWSAKFNYHPNDILHILYKIGYQCYVINENGRLREFSMVDENTPETNYFFFHKNKHIKILDKLRRLK